MKDMLKDAGNQSYFWSGFGAFWAMYSFEEKLALASLCVGVGTFLVNAYAKREQNKREREIHELTVRKMKQEIANESKNAD